MYTNRQIQKMVKDAKAWLETPEGKAAMVDAIRTAMNATNRLKEQRRVSAEMRNRIFDI